MTCIGQSGIVCKAGAALVRRRPDLIGSVYRAGGRISGELLI